MTEVESGSYKLAYIDVTRGIAILLVILTHHLQAVSSALGMAQTAEHYGDMARLGVQMFFVASALTLCLSFKSRAEDAGRLRNFYLRRFFRIAPLYYFAIILYGTIRGFGIGPQEPATAADTVINALFIHGFFNDAQNSVVPGGWSISAEMCFYAIFPFVFGAMQKGQERYGNRLVSGAVILACTSYGLAWLTFSALSGYNIVLGNVFWYWPPAQIPVFLIGMLFYFVTAEEGVASLHPFRDFAALLIMLCVTTLLWVVASPLALLAVPVTASVAFIMLVRLLARFVRQPGVVGAIGGVSYSMYVLHFLIVWFLDEPLMVFVASITSSKLAAATTGFLIVTAVSFVAAHITKWIIEDPGIRVGRSLGRATRRDLYSA